MRPRIRLLSAFLLAILFLTAARGLAHASSPCGQESLTEDRLYRIAGVLYGVDSGLLRAIAKVESGKNPEAVSPKGAQGLMQLMPDTATEYDVNDPFDPVDNLLGAARFLRRLQALSLTQGDLGATLPAVIAAYNSGPLAVARYGGIPPYPETREYVRRVLYEYLSCTHSQGPAAPPRRTPPSPAVRKPSDAHWLSQLEQIRRSRDSATSP
jgi:soluble lytic murein transglycosylase-like protein